MLTKCATFLTNKLNSNLNFSDDEKDIYIYGFELLLSNLLTMFIMLIISILFGNIFYILSFICIFFVPRLFCGGLHANSHLKCTLMTNAIFISTIILSKLFVYMNLEFAIIILSALSLIVIVTLCPIVNTNHPVSEKRYKKNKRFSIVISIINILAIVVLFCSTNCAEITTFSGVLFIWVSILVLIESLKQRRENNGNN
jgi:accessory gene regulator B